MYTYTCVQQVVKAYFSFISFADLVTFPCLLNFITPNTIPTTKSVKTMPATSPPRKFTSVTTFAPLPAAAEDCPSVMGQI